MDNKLRETTKLCEEIMNRKRQVKGKPGHVVQIIRIKSGELTAR